MAVWFSAQEYPFPWSSTSAAKKNYTFLGSFVLAHKKIFSIQGNSACGGVSKEIVEHIGQLFKQSRETDSSSRLLELKPSPLFSSN